MTWACFYQSVTLSCNLEGLQYETLFWKGWKLHVCRFKLWTPHKRLTHDRLAITSRTGNVENRIFRFFRDVKVKYATMMCVTVVVWLACNCVWTGLTSTQQRLTAFRPHHRKRDQWWHAQTWAVHGHHPWIAHLPKAPPSDSCACQMVLKCHLKRVGPAQQAWIVNCA